MILSINPWYYCNFSCEFCYLTKTQLDDTNRLDLRKLELMLHDILSRDTIEKVDLYGGELGVLPLDYWNQLIELLNDFGIDDINLVTNLSMLNDVTLDPRVHTSVSYDFDAREQHDKVFKNMSMLDKPFSILMLASPNLIKNDSNEMIETLNLLSNLQSVEIKPYSSNQANELNITYVQFEEFVKKWVINKNKKFEFVNELLLKDVLSKNRNAFSDNHVYITPNGRYGVLEFDLNDNEYFKEYDSLDDYYKWTELEKKRTSDNIYCSNCEYYGHCLSEHLRDVKNLDNSCNGFRGLITWFKTI